MDIKEWIRTHQMLCGVFVVGVAFITYLVSAHLRQQPEAALFVSFVNEYQDVGEGTACYDGFVDEAGLLGERVVFDTGYYFDLSEGKDFANSYFQKLVAYLENGTTDVVICSEGNLRGIAQGGRVLDLRDERAGDLADAYPDRLYWYVTDEGERVPVGIALSGSPYEEDFGYTEPIYAAIGMNTAHGSAAVQWIRYLISE